MRKIRSNIHQQLSDFTTPVNVLLAVREKYPISLLLESSDYQSKENSLSFIGFEPLATLKVEAGKLFIDGIEQKKLNLSNNVLTNVIGEFWSDFKLESDNPYVKKFNGLFGYTTFETVQYFDNFHFDPQKRNDDIPDLQFQFFAYLIVFDHYNSRLTLIENLVDDQESSMEEIISLINRPTRSIYAFTPGKVTANITDREFKNMVTKAKEHCKRGDVFQLVLSRKYVQQFSGDDINVYRALRAINPSPYLFYFDYGNFKIMGSSPEAELVVRGNRAEIHPIAGTMKRTGDNEADNEAANRLATDPKENAEHNMLVDLARNDLSKSCEDVQVSSNKVIQYFSHVIHLVSKVIGNKPDTLSSFKVFEDTFPAGTLSGAPKYKAIELINHYEPRERGFYGGAIGYLSFSGDLNMAITIRSILSRNQELQYQAGAGIVISSSEESELQEVENKLGAIQEAIELAKTL